MQKTLAKALFTKTLSEKGDKEGKVQVCGLKTGRSWHFYSNKDLGLAAGAENFSISTSGSCAVQQRK